MVASLPVANNRPDDGGGGGCSANACDPNKRCGNGLEKIYPTCAVRFGYMRYLGEFRYAPGMLFGCGQKVVIQTQRGVEIGQQVSLTCSGCDKSVSRDQIMKYVKNSGPEFLQLKAGKILRAASPTDLSEDAHIQQQAGRQLVRARELVKESGMDMKLVACEHLFGGERVIFHFLSEARIDFRDIVRTFAHEFNTRIEMHQVGARDEARLVADYEICGRECCCKNFLKKLRPVSMRMAKLQKATLDPSKVSGRCGRLRCCLRYEHEGYEVLDKKLPRNGGRLRTERGYCTVIDRQILTQLLHVRFDNGATEVVAIEDVLERDLPRNFGAPPPDPRQAEGDRGRPGDRPNRGDRDRNGGRDRRPPDNRRDQRPRDGGDQPRRPIDSEPADNRGPAQPSDQTTAEQSHDAISPEDAAEPSADRAFEERFDAFEANQESTEGRAPFTEQPDDAANDDFASGLGEDDDPADETQSDAAPPSTRPPMDRPPGDGHRPQPPGSQAGGPRDGHEGRRRRRRGGRGRRRRGHGPGGEGHPPGGGPPAGPSQ